MTQYTHQLLAAERRGRALALAQRPGSGDAWTIRLGHGPDACALMTAARWAARFGAVVHMTIPDRADTSRVWRDLAESCRLQGLAADAAGPPYPNRLVVTQDGQDWEIGELPDPDAAWQTTLADSWRMVRPVGPDTLRMSTEQCRRVDAAAIRQFGVPGLCLMENASLAAAAVAMDMLPAPGGRSALVVAGGGNNGGDALAVARFLSWLGVGTEVALLKPADSLKGDALANFRLLGEIPGLSIHHLADNPAGLRPLADKAGLIVDGLLGTGFQGALSSAFRQAVDIVNETGIPVLGLDIPSGLHGDTGAVADAAVRCARTITFAAVKHGLEKGAGPECTGPLFIGDIGAPAATLAV